MNFLSLSFFFALLKPFEPLAHIIIKSFLLVLIESFQKEII